MGVLVSILLLTPSERHRTAIVKSAVAVKAQRVRGEDVLRSGVEYGVSARYLPHGMNGQHMAQRRGYDEILEIAPMCPCANLNP